MTASAKRTSRPTPVGRGRAGISILFLRRAEKHGGFQVAETLRDTYQHMDADEDMREETLTQRMNDAIRRQKRLHNILR